eukprot:4853954-Prymnesium_polylepis.1
MASWSLSDHTMKLSMNSQILTRNLTTAPKAQDTHLADSRPETPHPFGPGCALTQDTTEASKHDERAQPWHNTRGKRL